MNQTNSESHLGLPPAPKRILTAFDWVLVISAPCIFYLGGLGVAFKNTNGLILVAFAGLIVITLRTIRLGKINEPRIPRWTGPGSIVVSAFGFVWAWNLLQNPPSSSLEQFALPLVPVALYIALVLPMLLPRRR